MQAQFSGKAELLILLNRTLSHLSFMPSTILSIAKPDFALTALSRMASDVFQLRIGFVNVFFIGKKSKWFLIDAGFAPVNANLIVRTAASVFGKSNPPQAILLTHAHFDHVGALESLVNKWQVPVFAHPLEVPYLNGGASYPPADPAVGGGAMSVVFSRFFPVGPFTLNYPVQNLKEGPFGPMPGWDVIDSPGHSPGHVSFYRKKDGVLLSGDAFITMNQESFFSSALTHLPEIHRPPAYFTQDWEKAMASVRTLAALKPLTVASGHGQPMKGKPMQNALHKLAANFKDFIPARGRYVKQPAIFDETGPVFVPPRVWDPIFPWLGGIALATLVISLLSQTLSRSSASEKRV